MLCISVSSAKDRVFVPPEFFGQNPFCSCLSKVLYIMLCISVSPARDHVFQLSFPTEPILLLYIKCTIYYAVYFSVASQRSCVPPQVPDRTHSSLVYQKYFILCCVFQCRQPETTCSTSVSRQNGRLQTSTCSSQCLVITIAIYKDTAKNAPN